VAAKYHCGLINANCTFGLLKKDSSMAESLFSAFAPQTYSDWLQQMTKDLKGKPFESLESFTADGLKIHPMYAADFPVQEIGGQPTKVNPAWVVVEEIMVDDAKKANKETLDKLNRGANGLLFYVYDDVDVARLLKGVLMEHISIHFVVEGNAQIVLENWLAFAEKQGLSPDKIRGSINIDPIENAARTGNWRGDAESDLMDLEALMESAPAGIKTICVNTNLYGNAGATPAQQLGIALAHCYEYINRLGSKNANLIWLNMAIGGNYFEEIAKFRAMRRLWKFLLAELKVPDVPLHLYAETGFRNKTIYDPWVNMLRSTTECMSAALGGADEILLRPYNSTFTEPQEFGNRVARNQQLVLAYESYFNRVNDPSAGSYFVENLTEELAIKGWEIFKEIEAKGGMIAALASGFIQKMIEKSAHNEQAKFNEGKINLLGSNIYPNENEMMKQVIEEPLFSGTPQDTQILPIVAKRLAEGLEKDRLEEEVWER
jgi:methylmalonyl-CoA mutase